MSPIGEWDDDRAANGTAHGAASSAIEAAVGRVDLKAAAAQAGATAMHRRLDAIAAAAVNEVLKPVLPALREAADAAALKALDAPAAAEDEPQPYFPDLMSFVTEYLAPMYRRSLSGPGMTWCAQWCNHAEAIARLEALWRAWEYLRQDPHTGMSVWFRDHADHHMNVLLNADGPFKGCKPDSHAERLEQLPTTPPADGRATLR